MARRSKYRAVPTTVDNVRFASKREAKRYGELQLLLRAGKIADLELQPKYPLHAPGGQRIGHYIADFRYTDLDTGKTVVEDSKGFRNQTYIWKKRHVEAEHGIEVKEV